MRLTLTRLSFVAAALVFVATWNIGVGQEQQAPIANPGVDVSGDSLPANALLRLGTARLRHGSRILCLAYAPTSRMLAAGGGDDPVRLWDADSGKEIRTLPEPWVYALAFSPRGSIIATAGAFKTIRLWETATGKEAHKLEGHTTAVKAMAISPDGSMLASGSQDGLILLWELLTAKIITQFKGHTDEITALSFSPDSSQLISGSSDRTVKLWDCDNGKLVRGWDAGCAVSAVAFGEEGKSVLSAGDDQRVRVWNAVDGKPRVTLEGHKGTVVSLLVARDGKTIYSGGADGAIRIWDLTTSQQTGVIARDRGDSDAMALTKDGKFIASAGTNNTIRIFETASRKEVIPAAGPQAGIASLALSPDSRQLVMGVATGLIRLRTGTDFRHWESGHTGEFLLAFSPDGQTVVSASGTDPIRFWNPENGQEKMQLPGNPADPVLSIAFSPNGQHLAVGRRLQHAELWDIAAKKIVEQWKYPGPVYALAFSPDGSRLALSGAGKIAMIPLKNPKESSLFDSKADATPAALTTVASLAFSPDSKVLAAGCYDGAIRLLDAATGKELRAMEGHGNVPYALAFSKDGRTLASASFDKTVRLWETFSGSQIASFTGHRGPVPALAFHGDGRGVFSGSADTSVLLWDVTGFSPAGLLPAMTLNPPDLDTIWKELATENTPVGHRALWKLVAGARDGVPHIDKTVYFVNPSYVDKLFKDLNSDIFEVRNKASKEIEKYGRWMEGRLKEIQKNPPTLEVQRRVDQLLAKLQVPGSLTLNQERLRMHRTMLALEQIASPQAIEVLEKLSEGAPEQYLQQEARASLERIRAK